MDKRRRTMMVDHGLPGLSSSPDTIELVKALVAAQAKFPAIEKGGNNTFGKYKYLRYSDICEAVREALNGSGLMLPHVCLTRVGTEWIAVGTLRHTSGQWITSLCPLYLGFDKAGQPRLDMQSLGSAYTYAKKYLLLGLVGAWAEDDDDGQKTMPVPPSRAPDRGLEIEQAAKNEIDKAVTAAEVGKVLSLVKLRVSEKVAAPDVLKRVSAYADQKKESINGQFE
jgi:hypothetical protein